MSGMKREVAVCLTSAPMGFKLGDLLRESLLLIVATEGWMMRKTTKNPGEKIVKDIKRALCKPYSSEEKIGIVDRIGWPGQHY
jgi:hypothetical protein